MNVWCRGTSLCLFAIALLPSCARTSPVQNGPKEPVATTPGTALPAPSTRSAPADSSQSALAPKALPASLPKAESAAHSTPAPSTIDPNKTATPSTKPSDAAYAHAAPSSAEASTNPAPSAANSLPKLELKAVGLHVGGGPNDAATQHAFGAPIALQFQEFMRCYRSVETPKALAIFGVDLVVPAGEGRARVRKIRTTLKGKEFQVCMQNAFETVRFRNPLKQPTSVSYSVRFALLGLKP